MTYRGIVWPSPNPADPPPHARLLGLMRDVAGANSVRINIPTTKNIDRIDAILKVGLRPLALLQPVGRTFGTSGLVQLAGDVARLTEVRDVELLNEPQGGPDATFTAQTYAEMATAAAYEIRRVDPTIRIWLFAEAVDVAKGTLKPYHTVVKSLVPADCYDGIAVHLYRAPNSANWVNRKLRTRADEWELVRQAAGPTKPILITEVGWPVHRPW